MLQSEDLPLAEVLDDNQWQDIFETHQIDFGNDADVVYTPTACLLTWNPKTLRLINGP
ncbi:hypothetical protein OAH18_00600 [bacterium]|nr:hypothetical protein [bacterium]